jgi:hypothetical protein
MTYDDPISSYGEPLGDSRSNATVATCDEDNSGLVLSLSHKGKGISKFGYWRVSRRYLAINNTGYCSDFARVSLNNAKSGNSLYRIGMAKRDGEIHSITDAQPSLTVDQRARQIRYFYSMMFRTACFIATIFLPNPWRWFTLAGAVVVPYIAVIVANAGRETITRPESLSRFNKRAIGGSNGTPITSIKHGTEESN